ncbi:hypothetical protein QBC34DRAFT_443898 [Podospora aff. communis PSN243]|uniref:F-box domain-containing protein n=1 Tax=Podospora aff. communis PSN243 TaxID=3040156 RepID=A0AAV9G1S6_9PEZI|nr:hypothetical protein QBC34DRAFT_443898 [Podospora aff. communis PSN243]
MSSLLSSPTEILMDIINHLNGQKMLAALSRTCKRLRPLALRCLYFKLSPRTLRPWLLARTLVTCTHLAKLVVSLNLNELPESVVDYIPREIDDYYRQKMKEGHKDWRYGLLASGHCLKSWPPHDVTTRLCSNLQFLDCDDNTSGTDYFWALNSLLKLRELVFTRRFHSPEGDFLRDNAAALLRAAPNLEKIQFRGFRGVGRLDIVLEKLKTVHFQNGRLGAMDLSEFLSTCPHLEELVYYCDSPPEYWSEHKNFGLREATDVILGHGDLKKLRYVYLDFAGLRNWKGTYVQGEPVQEARKRFADRGILLGLCM